MADFFKSDHFKLLDRWKGQKRDASNPEQNRAYKDLQVAYGVTEVWANEVKNRLFPQGRVEIRKRPTNQGNNFAPYNWAKIFPNGTAPKELAYTVGIDALLGFIVKIDTVGVDDGSALRGAYLAIRGETDSSSPIVAIKARDVGLQLTFAQLVDWSIEAIKSLKLKYEDVVTQLKLANQLTDDEVLAHFNGKLEFSEFQKTWPPDYRASFCRLARAVNAAGLDWWHMSKHGQVRFGRKNPGFENAVGVLGVLRGKTKRTLSWVRDIGGLAPFNREVITAELVAKLETALQVDKDAFQRWLPRDAYPLGYWPDQLQIEQDNPADETEDGDMTTPNEHPPAFNRIYYGPPGTGKTYALQKLLLSDYTQDAAAVSPDEWRAKRRLDEFSSLTWWEAIAAALYDLGGTAKVAQIVAHPFIKVVITAKSRERNVTQTIWGSLQQHAVEESKTVKNKKRTDPLIFDKSGDAVWSFAGAWEEECASLIAIADEIKAGPQTGGTAIERFTFVTFHQSYGYEDFVEGLRPVLSNEGENSELRYEVKAGAFKELCRAARLSPGHRFAVVIDEINRGNISKILGELITLIEIDKRDLMDGSRPPVELTLAYSHEKFSVPANVDIIGSMNTADRSLALVDTALRRRFEFVASLPDTSNVPGSPLYGLKVISAGSTIDVREMLARMNERIEVLYDRDHTLGHAFFMPLAKIENDEERFTKLGSIFRGQVIPLLEEYFFEDWEKICLVLADNDNRKPADARFIITAAAQEQELLTLFGKEHGLELFEAKKRFLLQPGAFLNPLAYVGIYATDD